MVTADPRLRGEDRQEILGLVAAGLGRERGTLALADFAVLAYADETRLRFNAPTPVEAWTLRLTLRLADGTLWVGEAELFHWLSDQEWELVELTP